MAEPFVTQEKTDVQLSDLINKTFLLRLLLLILFTGYFFKMQNPKYIVVAHMTQGTKNQKEVSD